VGEADADAVDAAVSAGEDLEAQAVFFDYFAGEGDVAGDLGDEAAESGGFVLFREAEEAGLFAGFAESAQDSVFPALGGFGGCGTSRLSCVSCVSCVSGWPVVA
jgi:hypothetical protein